MRSLALALILAVTLVGGARAKTRAPAIDYVPQSAMETGSAPGLKATELSPNVRRFQLIFAKGDDVRAGLADFAAKNHLTIAHFTAIGALDSAVIGRSDPAKKAFRVVRLNEEMEVTSFTGNITRDRDGKPVVHGHIVVALLRNGQVYSGHLLQGRVSLTMQLYLDDSEPLSATVAASRPPAQ
jgi:predicted DNA-binding protein with PD1-like motif